VVSLGSAITFGFMLHAGSPSELSWWGAMPIFGTWCLLPFLIVLVLSWRWAAAPASQVLLAIAAVIITVPVPFILYDGLVATHHSTGALVFLFLPFYQLFVVVPLSVAAWWAVRKAAR
jgi:hypothetical protein